MFAYERQKGTLRRILTTPPTRKGTYIFGTFFGQALIALVQMILLAILPESGALLGFAALFFGIGLWRFRYE